MVEKRLDFPFTLGVFSSLENYRTVKDKRRVLLIDLGLPLALWAEPFRDLLSVLPSERQKEVSAGTSRILEASQRQWHLRNSRENPGQGDDSTHIAWGQWRAQSRCAWWWWICAPNFSQKPCSSAATRGHSCGTTLRTGTVCWWFKSPMRNLLAHLNE